MILNVPKYKPEMPSFIWNWPNQKSRGEVVYKATEEIFFPEFREEYENILTKMREAEKADEIKAAHQEYLDALARIFPEAAKDNIFGQKSKVPVWAKSKIQGFITCKILGFEYKDEEEKYTNSEKMLMFQVLLDDKAKRGQISEKKVLEVLAKKIRKKSK